MRILAHTTATTPTAAHSLAAAFATAPVPAVLAGVLVPAEVATPKRARKAATTARPEKAATTHHACRCAAFVTEDGVWTGCEATTARTFAPGHDAKLGSLLQQAALTGTPVYDEQTATWVSALQAASWFPFGRKVADRVAAVQAKNGACHDRDAAFRS